MGIVDVLNGVPSERETALLDLLPTGVLVIDSTATVLHANRTAADMLAAEVDDVVGISLIDRLLPEDAGFGADLLDDGSSFDNELMGPVRIRYTALDGSVRTTEFWSRRLPDGDGFVLSSAPDSTAQALVDAATSIASGSPIGDTIAVAIRGLESFPVTADACVLRCVDGTLEAMSDWPLGDFDPTRSDVPWARTARTGREESIDAGRLPAHLRHAARDAGYRAIWTCPVSHDADHEVAVLVIFRESDGMPTANQQRHTAQIVAVMELAFAQSRYRESLEEAALRDPLTGLGNRAHLDRLAEQSRRFAAVLYLDLDGFKDVNDEHGHAAGDEVLRSVGNRLTAALRGDDHILRIGGDEFVVVLAPLDRTNLDHVADRLVETLAEPYTLPGGIRVTVTASIGVGLHDHTPQLARALSAADDALLAAKRSGKRCWRIAPAPT